MYYADVQKRPFSDAGQYSFFRRENKRLLGHLRRFPRLPERHAVRYQQEWEFERYVLHKVRYEVEPGVVVSSYLIVPRRLGRSAAGVLALHEHNDEYRAGKSEVLGFVRNPVYTKLEAVPPNRGHRTPRSHRQFAYGRELAERGFVVLAPDFIGFEEYRDRGWHLDDYYETPGFLRGYEEMLSEKYLLHGSCLMAKHLHDMYVAVSVLTSLDEVDGTRIGVIGHSLGGTMAAVLCAFDRRLRAGVNSCGTLSYESFERSNRMETAETILPGFREEGRDFDFFLDMIPPTPFFAAHGLGNITVRGRRLLQKRRANFETVLFRGGHEFPARIRQRAYAFLGGTLASPE